jgi:hypothetical protein
MVRCAAASRIVPKSSGVLMISATRNILMPSGWACGQETLPFSAATGVLTKQINHLVAGAHGRDSSADARAASGND